MQIKEKVEFVDNEHGKIKITHKEPVEIGRIKYHISINQLSYIANGINLNLVDAAIFDYCYDFIACDNKTILKIERNGKSYKWIAYQKIIDEMPILGIKSKEVIARHLKKLCDLKLLEYFVDKELGNKTLFKLGELASNIKFFDIKDLSYLPESRYPIDSKVDTLSTPESNNTISIDPISIYNPPNPKASLSKDSFKGIYEKYPTICPYSKRPLYRSKFNLKTMDRLIRELGKDEMLEIIELYLKSCSIKKTYLKNFETFINNFPCRSDFVNDSNTQKEPTPMHNIPKHTVESEI